MCNCRTFLARRNALGHQQSYAAEQDYGSQQSEQQVAKDIKATSDVTPSIDEALTITANAPRQSAEVTDSGPEYNAPAVPRTYRLLEQLAEQSANQNFSTASGREAILPQQQNEQVVENLEASLKTTPSTGETLTTTPRPKVEVKKSELAPPGAVIPLGDYLTPEQLANVLTGISGSGPMYAASDISNYLSTENGQIIWSDREPYETLISSVGLTLPNELERLKHASSVREKIEGVWQYIKSFEYNAVSPQEGRNHQNILEASMYQRAAICEIANTLAAAILAELGVTNVHYVVGTMGGMGHAWLEVHEDGEWNIIDFTPSRMNGELEELVRNKGGMDLTITEPPANEMYMVGSSAEITDSGPEYNAPAVPRIYSPLEQLAEQSAHQNFSTASGREAILPQQQNEQVGKDINATSDVTPSIDEALTITANAPRQSAEITDSRPVYVNPSAVPKTDNPLEQLAQQSSPRDISAISASLNALTTTPLGLAGIALVGSAALYLAQAGLHAGLSRLSKRMSWARSGNDVDVPVTLRQIGEIIGVNVIPGTGEQIIYDKRTLYIPPDQLSKQPLELVVAALPVLDRQLSPGKMLGIYGRIAEAIR